MIDQDQRIADEIDAAIDSYKRARRSAKGGLAVMDCDIREAQRRLMKLDELLTRYDFSGREVIAAAVERGHRAMYSGGGA